MGVEPPLLAKPLLARVRTEEAAAEVWEAQP